MHRELRAQNLAVWRSVGVKLTAPAATGPANTAILDALRSNAHSALLLVYCIRVLIRILTRTQLQLVRSVVSYTMVHLVEFKQKHSRTIRRNRFLAVTCNCNSLRLGLAMTVPSSTRAP